MSHEQQQNLKNQCSHQFGDGNEMTISQKIEFVKSQEEESNETKETAVDFYRENLHKLVTSGDAKFSTENEIYNYAKKIENEQKFKDFKEGYENGYQNGQIDLMK